MRLLLLQSIFDSFRLNKKQLKNMACGELCFIYTLFTCEGAEENAFTGKDIVKHYMW